MQHLLRIIQLIKLQALIQVNLQRHVHAYVPKRNKREEEVQRLVHDGRERADAGDADAANDGAQETHVVTLVGEDGEGCLPVGEMRVHVEVAPERDEHEKDANQREAERSDAAGLGGG